jgi:hypothetical protein
MRTAMTGSVSLCERMKSRQRFSNLNRRLKVSVHKIKTTHRDGQIAARFASTTGAQDEQ